MMKNKIVMFSVVLLSLVSCSAKRDSMSGEYVTRERTKTNDLYNYVVGNKLLFGISLKLNPDSTYVYTSCAQVNIGKWYVVKDTLKLKCEKLSFISEAANKDPKYKNGTICSDVPKSLFIDGDTFEEKIKHKRLGTYSIILNRK